MLNPGHECKGHEDLSLRTIGVHKSEGPCMHANCDPLTCQDRSTRYLAFLYAASCRTQHGAQSSCEQEFTCQRRALDAGPPFQAQTVSMAGVALLRQVASAFMAATSSLVAKRPLMRGRTSAYALRL